VQERFGEQRGLSADDVDWNIRPNHKVRVLDFIGERGLCNQDFADLFCGPFPSGEACCLGFGGASNGYDGVEEGMCMRFKEQRNLCDEPGPYFPCARREWKPLGSDAWVED
jgi:hypothetical protein